MVNFFSFLSFFFFFFFPRKLWSPTKARGQYHFYRGYESGENTKPRIVWRDRIEHTNLERHYAAQGHCSRWEIKFKLSAGRIIQPPAKKKISRIVITKKQIRSPYSPTLFQNCVISVFSPPLTPSLSLCFSLSLCASLTRMRSLFVYMKKHSRVKKHLHDLVLKFFFSFCVWFNGYFIRMN